MKQPFRCPHLLAKSLCIPLVPSIMYMVFCSVVLHTFYWMNTGPFLFYPKKSPTPTPNCFITQWMRLWLFILQTFLPQVSMLYPILFVVVWKSGLMTDFISQNLLPIVYIAVQSQWPHLHLGWMGGPTLTQFNKKIMRPLKAHRCVSTMKRVYNQCKCDVFLLCGHRGLTPISFAGSNQPPSLLWESNERYGLSSSLKKKSMWLDNLLKC